MPLHRCILKSKSSQLPLEGETRSSTVAVAAQHRWIVFGPLIALVVVKYCEWRISPVCEPAETPDGTFAGTPFLRWNSWLEPCWNPS